MVTGLTEEQVNERLANGLVNAAQKKITKTNWQIFRDNVLTLFNLFNFLIGAALFYVKAYMNLLYLLIVVINIFIRVAQEVRARNLVNKLSLLSAQNARVLRDGKEIEIPVEQIVLDDVIVFQAGNQICTDSIVLDGGIEVNESLLTGEADAVQKQEGGSLLSGSFVVSGKCCARAEHVGADNFVAQLSQGAKKYKKLHSELLRSMSKVTKLTAFLIPPLGVLLFIQAYVLRKAALDVSVVSAAAALLGMLPKGLVLLISIALITGVIGLSKKKILVQEMQSLETLARADVLCLDKTGTLTVGEMAVSDFYVTDETAFPVPAETALAAFAAASGDNNSTFVALKKYFLSCHGPARHESCPHGPLSVIPFSSERKFSAVTFDGFGTIVVDAPERLYADGNIPQRIIDRQAAGIRVLCAGFTAEPVSADTLPELKAGAVIELSDPIRGDAKKTLDFFRREGVDIKIISGDNPLTVAGIAGQAGFEKSGEFVDMSAVETDGEIEAAAAEYSVFGRVSPAQKQKLVAAMKKQGHTVAMAGDGVNDVLALREADCGIAMGAGSDAARQVSQLVLTGSDFTSLPDAIMEGRRVINNMTRVAGVFFIKTIYSVLLSLLFIILNVPFPFVPVQITLIDLAIEAFPAFFISFEKSGGRVKGGFLGTVTKNALPHAVLILLTMAAVLIMRKPLNLSDGDSLAIMYFITGFISLAAVFRSCLPFNRLRAGLFAVSFVGFYAAIYLFSNILKIALPSKNALFIILALAAACLPLLLLLTFLTEKIYGKILKLGIDKTQKPL